LAAFLDPPSHKLSRSSTRVSNEKIAIGLPRSIEYQLMDLLILLGFCMEQGCITLVDQASTECFGN
jgi:hypothetical protein